VILLALGACATAAPPARKPAALTASEGSPVVARTAVGDVTEQQLDAAIAARPKLARQLYELRHDALEDLVLQRLVEAAAKKQGLTVDAYLRREVDDRAKPPTEQEVRAFFDRELQSSGAYHYDEIRDQLAAHILSERRKQATMALVKRLRTEAHVEILLVPPRIAVTGNGPSRGPSKAAVTIVEFSDFQCPYCRQEAITLRRVLDEYPHDVRLVFLDFPLSAHPDARNAAQAARCAGEQGQFWAMHDLLFAHQDALSPDDLRRYAQKTGVDPTKFDACVSSGRSAPHIDESIRLGEEVGVDGTPALFINGRPLSGATPYPELKQTIDEELALHLAADHP
jgi:predicted DsbA family dithiol-disulfide isomerase